MIRTTTPDGKPWLLANAKEINAANAWARAVCHAILGPDEGEKFYRTLPALTVLRAWSLLTPVDQ